MVSTTKISLDSLEDVFQIVPPTQEMQKVHPWALVRVLTIVPQVYGIPAHLQYFLKWFTENHVLLMSWAAPQGVWIH